MKKKYLALTLGTIITSLLILFSCRKINEATDLGGDLIPPVDNIHTFDTTLDVQVFNDSFTVVTDSTKSFPGFQHFLGKINTDPFFGKTDARMFFELKPSTYRFTFADKPDSLHIDSVVLVLDYAQTYGDSTIPQTVNVYEVGGNISDFRYDTLYRYRENTIPKAGLLGFRTFLPRDLDDSVKAFQDTTSRQLRIRLADAFGDRLLKYDTAANGPYTSDSNFRQNFKGFALESVAGGNAIMGFNLVSTNTKLAIYYKYDVAPGDFDTTVAYFTFTDFSAEANPVTRDYSGTPFAASVNGTTGPPDAFAFIQNAPGTFSTIKVPGLAGLSNRIVHRAELIMEEAWDVTDSLFPPPPRLYLDAIDPSKTLGFRSIPYDFILESTSNSNNLTTFGGIPFRALDNGNHSIYTWRFNLSRYVQNIVTGKEPALDLRLSAPAYTVEDYGTAAATGLRSIYVNANLDVQNGSGVPVMGRVRLYGGDATQVNPHRMRLRVVYSKI